MGALIGGLILGLIAGIAIASGSYKRKLAEAEREKQSALRQQREMFERERELQLRALTQTLQADCDRQLQAREATWRDKLADLEAQLQPAFEPPSEPVDDFQQYESLLDLLDDEEELEAREF